VKRYWNDDVVDQAIAVDWLLCRSGRADEALLGLWLSGYTVDPAAAQLAWIEDLKRVQHRRQQAASRLSGRFSGLGRSWWKRLKSNAAFTLPWWRQLPDSDRENISNFLGDTQEWLRDDEERDDDAYRYAIADLIIGFTKTDRKAFYKQIDDVWADIDLKSLFAITSYIEFVKSMSLEELDAAQESLSRVTNMLRRVAELLGHADRVDAVIIPLLLMSQLLGTLIARILIKTLRVIPEIPLEESIAILHDLVVRVQSTDITNKIDGRFGFSERVNAEWEVVKKKLLQLWDQALESEDQPLTMNGPPDPASG
jgi:hypothetical protein